MSDSDVLTEADIVVIGAGVMGSSIAYQLGRRTNQKVVVVDRSPPLGGMSGRTFGQVRLHYSNILMLKMAQYGQRVFSDWANVVGYGDSGYVPMGYLLNVVQDQLEALHRNIDLARGLGIDTKFVTPAEIGALEPVINTEGLMGGVYDPLGGFIDVTRIVLSYLTAAQESGVRVMTGLQVAAIDTAGGAVAGVFTNNGLIKAPRVVTAAGAWSAGLLAPLGIDLPLEMRRLDMMYMTPGSGGGLVNGCVTDGNSNIVIRPGMGREFLAAAYPAEMPLVSDPASTAGADADREQVVRIEKSLSERFPGLVGAQPRRSVSGTYDITPDWHPVLGWVPGISGLYLAAGFSGHGLKLAPAVGEVVAAALLQTDPPFDVHPLRFERFAEDDLMYLAYGPGARG